MNKPQSHPLAGSNRLQLVQDAQPVKIDADLSIDHFIGSRIKRRREQIQMSQPNVAKKLGLSYQQLQKYERGDNRISAGQLFRLAQILDAPLGYFFPSVDIVAEDNDERLAIRREGAQLANAFQTIANPDIRRTILQFVARLSGIINPPADGARRRGRPRKSVQG